MNWTSRIRLRVLGLLVAIALFALGAISLTAVPVWPVVGVAVACAAMVVNHLAARLDQTTCLACGHSIAGEPGGEHGVACSRCGSVNQHAENRGALAARDGAVDEGPRV